MCNACTVHKPIRFPVYRFKVKLQFLSPAILDVSFTLDEIEEIDIEVAARPGQDNISVCTCLHVFGVYMFSSRCVHGFVYALFFINYLCFFLTFHRVRLTNNSGLSLRSTDWKST